MRCQETFVVLIMLVSIFDCGCGDEGLEFLNSKQDEVKAIAEAAQENYMHTCELVSTCQSAQNCSRLECYPFEDQSSELTCVYVDNNTQCINKTGSTCNTVEANFVRGYVRTPPLDYGFVGSSTTAALELDLGSTICAQRNLDSEFISVSNTLRSNSSLDYFYNLFFGAVDGSFRFYPGKEIVNNTGNDSWGTYDPRKRVPWYIGAISIDVVVLIDTGTSMQQTLYFDPMTSYLDLTTTLVGKIVADLTAGDRVTVIPVNGSGTVLRQPYSQYSVPISTEESSDPNFEGLVSYIANISAFVVNGGSDSNGGRTNFTDGFVAADSNVFAVSSPSSSMKIVILLTNSGTNSQIENTPNSADLTAADKLTGSGVKLFVYDLSNTNANASWGAHACDDGGNSELLAVNPLLFLSSYFSFLARARIEVSNGNLAFWQKPYVAADGLGEVITVAYPAMSADGLQLIGVAGIDVQLTGLDSNLALLQSVQTTVSSSNYGQIAINPNAGNLSICKSKYSDSSSCGSQSVQTESVCYGPTGHQASEHELLELLCCQECMKEGKHHHLYVILPSTLVVLVAILLVLVFAMIALVRRRRQKSKGSQRMKSFTLQDFSYETLREATNGFDRSNMVGKGSFGVVYKACIADQTVAVKQLIEAADRAEDFKAEIKILGTTSHPNLVELKGTCFQPTRCFLVYEFLGNGDLHDWLWPAPPLGEQSISDGEVGNVRFLTWNQRKIIARGVARGLNYLHRGLAPSGTVFHLDIKPHNILLEYNFNPKIADFGISQLYEPGYTCKMAPVGRGTLGYIPPEVLQGQLMPNSKLDVYSYGMVLLQLVSGRKIDDPDVKPFLRQWAKRYLEAGFVEKVVDEKVILNVQKEYREACMANCKKMVSMALRCLSDRPELRPEMSQVSETIDGLAEVIELQTPSILDYESDDKLGSQYLRNEAEEILPRSGCLMPFRCSRESGRQFHQLTVELNQEEIISRKREISTPPANGTGGEVHDENHSSGSKRGSTVPIKSSMDRSLTSALQMDNVQKEAKSGTLFLRSTKACNKLAFDVQKLLNSCR